MLIPGRASIDDEEGRDPNEKQETLSQGGGRASIHHFQTLYILISLAYETLFPLKSFAQSKKKRAGMADFFRNGLDGRWGMGMGENKN